jgi:hypothetical protein
MRIQGNLQVLTHVVALGVTVDGGCIPSLPQTIVAGIVYNDVIGNSAQDPSVPVAVGVPIILYSYAPRQIVPSTTTNPTCGFTFCILPPGGKAVLETVPSWTINMQTWWVHSRIILQQCVSQPIFHI